MNDDDEARAFRALAEEALGFSDASPESGFNSAEFQSWCTAVKAHLVRAFGPDSEYLKAGSPKGCMEARGTSGSAAA
jgi:hypothetical protein